MAYKESLQSNNTELGEILKSVRTLASAGVLDTSDATASEADILAGKTAYVNGEKITGTYVEDETAPKTYTLTATVQGDIYTIEVVRYYGSDGTQNDFISKVNGNSSRSLNGDDYIASSVVNADGYTGTVTSGILLSDNYSYYGEGEEEGYSSYIVYVSVSEGEVTLHMTDQYTPENNGYLSAYISIDYSIVTTS